MTAAVRTTQRAYPAYKDSGTEWLGEIPEHWALTKVKYIGEYINGLAFKPSEWEDEGTPIIRIQNISNPDADYNRTKQVFSDKYMITPGDILISWSASLGVHVWQREAGWLNQHIFKALPDSSQVDKSFFAWLAHWFVNELDKDAHGSTMQHVTWGKFGGFFVALPPLPEQEAIARFLDHKTAQIDALIAKKEALLACLADKRTALISQAVTQGLDPTVPMRDSGIEWLGEIPAHWEVVQLRRFGGLVQTGPFGSQLHSHEYVDDGYPVVNPANISEGRIIPNAKMTVSEEIRQRLSRHVLQEGDIVLGRRGELGRAAYISPTETGWLCGTGSILIRIDHPHIRTEFLAQYLLLQSIKDYLTVESVGSTMDNLNTDIINRIPIVLPPVDEQEQIVEHCKDLLIYSSEQVEKIQSAIDKLKQYRTALITNAVTGKIDVREAGPWGTEAPASS